MKYKRYRVTTDALKVFDKGETVVAVDCDGKGFPVMPTEHNGIDKNIVERNPDWFEPVEQVKEGQYCEHGGAIYRIMRKICDSMFPWTVKRVAGDDDMPDEDEFKERIIKPLSDDEVEQALIKEAKRRGYCEGVKIKHFIHKSLSEKTHTDRINKIVEWQYDPINDSLNLCYGLEGYHFFRVYYEGNWAEIIEDEWEIYQDSQVIYVTDDGRKIRASAVPAHSLTKSGIDELMQAHTNQALDKLKEKVQRRVSDIRNDIHEIEDKMNRYTFSKKEKIEGSTHYGALQERETRYKRQIRELQSVITLIDEVSNE